MNYRNSFSQNLANELMRNESLLKDIKSMHDKSDIGSDKNILN